MCLGRFEGEKEVEGGSFCFVWFLRFFFILRLEDLGWGRVG